MTPAQLAYAAEHLPLVEARRHLPIAQLEAVLREFITPRYTDDDPDEKKEPPRPRNPWDPLELLPPYASFGESRMTPEQARVLVEHCDALPSWVRGVAPIDEAKSITD